VAYARVLTGAHLATFAVGVVECVRGEAGIGTLLLCVAVLMLMLMRVQDITSM
jgi:hypothetical protein